MHYANNMSSNQLQTDQSQREVSLRVAHFPRFVGKLAPAELDGKGLPILLRQYAKIGGKMLGLNVDRKFSNVLDCLVVVDLRQTEPAALERYMEKNRP